MVTRNGLGLVAAMSLVVAACAAGPGSQVSEAERKGWAGTTVDINIDQVAAGKIIAQRECASCHAIDMVSSSKNSSAPPLREILAVNDADFVAYRLIDAMRLGHEQMPLFDFDVRSADALLAYIQSISNWR